MPSRQQIKYFDRFGKVNYDFSNENALAVMTNITKFIRAEDRGELSSYLYYDIQSGDRPDTIAYNVYGKSEYYWMIFLLNTRLHTGMNAWPLTDNEMDRYLEKEYDPYCWVSGDASDTNYIGNIPFDRKYLPHLRVTYSTNGYPFTGLKIKSYDYQRLGLVVYKDTQIDVLNLGLESTDTVTMAITHDASALGLEWADRCESLGLDGFTQEEEDYTRHSYYFQANNRFANILLKNATYRYYIDQYDLDGIAENGVLVPFQLLKHYQVIRDSVDPGIKLIELNDATSSAKVLDPDPYLVNLDFLSKVSFYQNERDDNEQKKKIRLPRKEIAADIALRYYKLIKR